MSVYASEFISGIYIGILPLHEQYVILVMAYIWLLRGIFVAGGRNAVTHICAMWKLYLFMGTCQECEICVYQCY